MARIGYARVSSVGQSLDVQIEKLKQCDKLFQEKRSGATDKRPKLATCLDYVREGDTLVVTRLTACRRERMKWGMSMTIQPAWSFFVAQKGVSGLLHTAGGEVNDILTITPTNC